MHTSHTSTTLIQITDTHLGRSPRPIRPGYPDSDAQLETVLNDIAIRHPAPELLLVTGDLAEDPESVTYRRLATRLTRTGVPVEALAGNHDDRELARQAFGTADHGFHGERLTGGWLIVSLDSSWPGHTAGWVGQPELQRLEANLRRFPDHWVLVAVHHPVVAVGSRWLDRIGLENGAELLAAMQRNPRVRACIFGHIHQEFDAMQGGIRLLGCPSTCVQFLPGAEDFALEPGEAGYRVLTLHPDGGLDTHVQRVAGTGPVEFTS